MVKMVHQRIRFGFYQGSNFHTLLSARENSKEELIVFPAYAADYSEIQQGNPNADRPILNQHYTIHNERVPGENILNHTLEYRDGGKTNTRLYSSAFSRTNLLCPIVGVRCQDLSIERYRTQLSESDVIVQLGEYDAKVATLYYLLAVGNAGRTISGSFPDFNVIRYDFTKYTLTLLWSFNSGPSYVNGEKMHFMTRQDVKTELENGFPDDEIVATYRQLRYMQHISFLEFMQGQYKHKLEIVTNMELLKQFGFMKTPHLNKGPHL